MKKRKGDGSLYPPEYRRMEMAKPLKREASLLFGRMFMVHVYGESLDDQSPVNVKENQILYGVDNASQLKNTTFL
ncbi:hypothetical protein [Ammoniphilus resinae]|uniref:Uncharacterized protein n=1 Tax=Ammoniphilus resinae TaxID=861532 RepID=A0ABS4GPJ3_9BACL|nr:hypothetical protein [Ammoniphilus resinae]MBP1932193.1 hypothetical protein [Ammoniphilus resinae]